MAEFAICLRRSSDTEYEALRTRLTGRTSSLPDMLGAFGSIFNQSLFQFLPVHSNADSLYRAAISGLSKHEPHKYLFTPAFGLGPSHFADNVAPTILLVRSTALLFSLARPVIPEFELFLVLTERPIYE